MIDILNFREWLAGLKEEVNRAMGPQDAHIDKVAIAVHEGHMVRKLRDKRGVFLCSNFPDADTQGDADCFESGNQVLLYVIEKVPSGQFSDEDEMVHYHGLQKIMRVLRGLLLDSGRDCGETVTDSAFRIEWEYDIFGGWNGLSISFKIKNYD